MLTYAFTYACTQLIHEAAYGEGSPLGSSIYADSLESLAPADVLAYRHKYFTATNTIVTSSGGLPHADLKALTECYFSGLPKGEPSSFPSPFIGGEARVKAAAEGAYAALAFGTAAGKKCE